MIVKWITKNLVKHQNFKKKKKNQFQEIFRASFDAKVCNYSAINFGFKYCEHCGNTFSDTFDLFLRYTLISHTFSRIACKRNSKIRKEKFPHANNFYTTKESVWKDVAKI